MILEIPEPVDNADEYPVIKRNVYFDTNPG
jgi:hypothetical protein